MQALRHALLEAILEAYTPLGLIKTDSTLRPLQLPIFDKLNHESVFQRLVMVLQDVYFTLVLFLLRVHFIIKLLELEVLGFKLILVLSREHFLVELGSIAQLRY